MTQSEKKHVHLMGIGGISMNGLALMLMEKGFEVSGCDMKESHLTRALREKGMAVSIGHGACHAENADILVYTAAISADHPEIVRAKEKGLLVYERAEMLGLLMQDYEKVIAVSGTHGKTTTTAMLSYMFTVAGHRPTIHIGGELPLIGGSVAIGDKNLMIAEACEYRGSFLHFHPTTAIILNIEFDHPDAFLDVEDVYRAFEGFSKNLSPDGLLIGCGDDPRTARLLKEAKGRKLSFGLSEGNDWQGRDLTFDDKGCASFQAYLKNKLFGHFRLKVPGKHHVYNALAAISAAWEEGLFPCEMQEGFENFLGAKRRFEYVSTVNGAEIYHDYAHHPTEIATLLETARLRCKGRIFCVFQPHTYSRTQALFEGFASVLAKADRTILADIDGVGREIGGVTSSAILADAVNQKGGKCCYMPTFEDIAKAILNETVKGDMVLLTGAGSIESLNKLFL